MKYFLPFIFVIAAIAQTSCASIPLRPANTPKNSVFSGGTLGGMWLDCKNEASIFECNIFNYTGRLYETGQFEFAPQLDACYPNFILSDYRYNNGFLIPNIVHQTSQNLYIIQRHNNIELPDAIIQSYNSFGTTNITNLEMHFSDTCQNGNYEATINGELIKGRIWAGRFYQIWDRKNR